MPLHRLPRSAQEIFSTFRSWAFVKVVDMVPFLLKSDIDHCPSFLNTSAANFPSIIAAWLASFSSEEKVFQTEAEECEAFSRTWSFASLTDLQTNASLPCAWPASVTLFVGDPHVSICELRFWLALLTFRNLYWCNVIVSKKIRHCFYIYGTVPCYMPWCG
jgi:hypothetical protein